MVEGGKWESSVSKKALPAPRAGGMGRRWGHPAQKPRHLTGSRSTVEAKKERKLHVGRGCLAGSGLLDETQLLPGTPPEAERG